MSDSAPQQQQQTVTGRSASPRIGVVDVLRFFVEIGAIVALTWWGFASFSLPWNIVAGLGAPLVFIGIWGLFIAPKSVLRIDRYLRAVIELLLWTGAALAIIGLGLPWLAGVFAIVAVGTGLITGLKRR